MGSLNQVMILVNLELIFMIFEEDFTQATAFSEHILQNFQRNTKSEGDQGVGKNENLRGARNIFLAPSNSHVSGSSA